MAWVWFKAFCKEWGAMILVVAAIIAFAYPIIDAFNKATIELWITIGFAVSLALFVLVSIRMHQRILNRINKLQSDPQGDNLSESLIAKTRPLTKIEIVLQAIDEAMTIIPNGKDVPVYITGTNYLKSMYPQEILDILTRLQDDDKTIQVISFPTWLLPSDKLTGKDISDGVRAAIDPSLNKFVVQILDGFKSKN